MLEITWKLAPGEADLILNTLAEKPYRDVAALITKLHLAAKEQVAAYEKEKAVGPDRAD